MIKALLILALAVAPMLGQQNPDERTARLVHLKYADPNAVADLIRPFGVSAVPDEKLRVITLQGRRANVDATEAAIKELDVPSAAPKDVDLTVYFVVGTDSPGEEAGPVPQELQGTVAALKQTFPFKTYTLLDALSLRSRTGTGSSSTGRLSAGRTTQFQVRSASVEQDGGTIRLDRLQASLRVPRTVVTSVKGMDVERKVEYQDTGINTEVVDVKEGQKLVVGRTSLEGPGRALFLVLIAKVVP